MVHIWLVFLVKVGVKRVETEKLQEKLVEVLCEELDLLKKNENNLRINEFAYLVDSLRRLKEVEKR